MKKMINKHPEECKYCYRNLDRQDIHNNGCGCGMKKCYFDCETEKEKREWEDEEGK